MTDSASDGPRVTGASPGAPGEPGPQKTAPATGGVPWWRSIRLRIAAAVAVVALTISGGLGFLITLEASQTSRELLRDEAAGRLSVAVDGYRVDGRLRNGVTTDPAAGPSELVKPSTVGQVLTYFDGRTMWASERLGPEVILTASVDGEWLTMQDEQRISALLGALLAAAVLASVVGWLVATTLSRRLRRAASGVGNLARESETRVHEGGSDEVAALTRAIDDMAAVLQRRIATERAFTADVAHELRTPVTGLVSATELLDDGEVPALVRRQVARLRRLVDDLLEVSRLESGTDAADLQRLDLGEVVTSLVGSAPGLELAGLRIESSAEVAVDPRRLERTLANLVGNAARHGGSTGSACQIVVAGRSVSVLDSGPGYPADVIEAGPRRFHAVGASKGSGLGLTIATGQAAVMGAHLTLANRPEGGAAATITFPDPGEPDPSRPG